MEQYGEFVAAVKRLPDDTWLSAFLEMTGLRDEGKERAKKFLRSTVAELEHVYPPFVDTLEAVRALEKELGEACG